jgi:sugar lactone lactonase YvrE
MNIFKKMSATLMLATLTISVSAQSQVKSEVYASFDQAISTITYTKDKRFIFTFHPFYNPKVKVAERLENGEIRPFPNADMQNAYDSEGKLKNPGEYFNWTLAVHADNQGQVWILDSGQAEPRITPKLVAWDTKTNKLAKVIYLPDGVTLDESQHNDFIVSKQHHLIVIADEGIAKGPVGEKAALVVVNTQTGKSRRVLQGTESIKPHMDLPMVYAKGTQQERQAGLYIGVDGIALDKQEEWMYYTPVSQSKVYRIRVADLANEALSDTQLAKKVQTYADKPVNGGLTIDAQGNLYLCAIGDRSIGIIPADTKEYRTLTSSSDMIWPDAVNFGPDGYLYTAATQIWLSAPLNQGKGTNKAPYLIYRFKPEGEPLIGR